MNIQRPYNPQLGYLYTLVKQIDVLHRQPFFFSAHKQQGLLGEIEVW